MKEIWKNIENFEDYQISNLGRIKSFKLKKEKILNFKKNKCGYLVVGLYNDKQKNNENIFSKNINQYDLNDKFIKTWANKREIQRNLGFDNSNIVKCCIGKQKTAYGYKWEYKEG